MTTRYANHVNRKQTPQSEPIPGTAQVANSAGGYAYALEKWARLQRFLILGADGGTYYVTERTLTRDNAQVVEACLDENPQRTIDAIVAVSDAGRAPKNDPAILALAIAASVPAERQATRALAYAALPLVCRIPTHLFHFFAYCKAMRGWSRGLRNAVTRWYLRWPPETLAYELVKYQGRDGWTNRDAFRLAHGRYPAAHQAALRWALGLDPAERTVTRKSRQTMTQPGMGTPYPAESRYVAAGELPGVLAAFEEAKTATPKRIVALIRAHNLTREMLPSEALNHVAVWEALLEKMPLTALVRSLGKMTTVGLLVPLGDASKLVAQKLADAVQIKQARLHPLALLVAQKIYGQGHGDKGSLAWEPVQTVVDALDAAFYLAFGNVEPTGKKVMLACDISGSMDDGSVAGSPLTPREAVAALAMVTARVELEHLFVGFTTTLTELAISPKHRLDQVVRYMQGLHMGGTDCAAPMTYATERKLDVDAFVVLTDSETWHGGIHPSQALRAYRAKRGRQEACSVVVGMTATGFTIADPDDPRMLDVVGFDTATPSVISEFVRA